MTSARRWVTTGSTKALWQAIAGLRQAEGDHEGAARARRNASVYADRYYGDWNKHYWRDNARAKYLPDGANHG